MDSIQHILRADGRPYTPARPNDYRVDPTDAVRQVRLIDWKMVGETILRYKELPASSFTGNKEGAILVETLIEGKDSLTHMPVQCVVPIAGVNFMTHYGDDPQTDPRNAWAPGVVAWDELMKGGPGYPQAADIDKPLFQGVQYGANVLEQRIVVSKAREEAERRLGTTAATSNLTVGSVNIDAATS